MRRAACVCVFPHPYTSRPSLASPILRRAPSHSRSNCFPICPRACVFVRPCGDRPLILLPFSPHRIRASTHPTSSRCVFVFVFPALISAPPPPPTPNATQRPTRAPAGPPTDTNWFDFLSGPTSNGSGAGLSLPPPVPPLNSARFGFGSPGMGRKRLREDSVL
ncbi:hypothetical protein V8D89_016192, partial [Ganoderma adspersum]